MKSSNKTKSQVIKELEALRLYTAELEKVEAEQKLVEVRLRASQERYRGTLDNMLEGCQIIGFDWRYLYVNDAVAKHGRHIKEELLGHTMMEMYPGIENTEMFAELRSCMEKRTSHRMENEFTFPEGSKGWFELSMEPVAEGVLVLSSDITERKRAEETLQESEEKYRNVVERANDGICIIQDGIVKYLNPRLANMWSGTVEEFIDTPFIEHLHSGNLREMADLYKRRIAGEDVPPVYEITLVRKDGSRLYGEVNASAIKYEGKSTDLVIIRDVTERKQMVEALRHSEERYRTILDEIEEGYYEVGLAGNFTFVNNATCRQFGYSKEELIGMNYRAYVPKEDVKSVYKAWNKVYRTGKPLKLYPFASVRKDGTQIFLENSVSPLRNDEGKTIGFRSISRDVTERKRAEEKMQHSKLVLRAIRNVNQLIARRTDRDSLLKGTCENFVETRGYYNAWIALLDESGKLVVAAEAGLGKNFLQMIERLKRSELPDCGRKILKKSGVVVIEDPSLACTDCPLAKDYSGRGEMSVRLEYGEKVYGLMTVSIPPGIAGEKEEQGLFEEVAGDIAFALYSMEQEEERKRAEGALRRSEEKYRNILSEMQDSYFEVDFAGNLTFFNDSTSNSLGYSAEELMGMSYREFTASEDIKLVYKVFNKVYRTNRPNKGFLWKIVRKDGTVGFVEATVSPLRNPKGEIIGFRGVGRDVTERKRAEEERRQLEQKAQVTSRLASVGEMAAGVAHEINNPLTGVIGYAQLLMDGKDIPSDIRRDLAAINEGAQRVASIVKRLLTFSRQVKPERRDVDINELIESTLALRAYHLRVNNIKVTIQLAPDLPETVADPGQLQQVFLNLVVNAETEMKLAHGKGKLLIKTEKVDNTIRISFKDNGPGIAKKNLERIFDPFFTTRALGQGTGLGLSLCHGIVAEHKGRIYAESKLGKGATFIMELPVVTEAEQPKPSEPVVEEPEKVAKARILVVDDEQVIRDFVKRVLAGEGYEVETVDNAGDALKKIEGKRYNLVLIDIKMPGMDGVELYRRIQKIAQSLARRVVFITGDIMGAATKKFLSETKAAHIDKPFNAEQLSREVNRALTGGR
jgi:PAS domain S-box-containing protein